MKTINYKDKTITFIPTAHVSKESVLEVKEAIDSLQPDTVCIELDSARAASLMNPDKYQNFDVKKIIKDGKAPSFLANLLLSSYQKRLADDLGTLVGAEMIQAIQSGKEVNARIDYIDRDINVTMKRLWNGMSLYKKSGLIVSLGATLFEKEDLDSQDVEDLKQSDLLFEAMKEMDEEFPEVSKQILHERNYYMAEKLKQTTGTNIVCVIGAAHLDGIIESLEEEHSLQELVLLPEKKKNYLGWIIPITFIGIITFLTLQNPATGLTQLLIWLGLASVLAVVGCIVTLAHPYTYVAGIVGAPIGVLSPFLATGMFTGLAQAYAHPPRIQDFDTLADDITKPKRWYSNRLLKILMIAIVTNILVSISTFVAGSSIISSLF